MALLTQSNRTIKETRLSSTRLLLVFALAAGLLCSCAAETAQPAPLPAVAPSRSTTAESSATLPEPCSLLTQADLVSALAELFQAGEAGVLPAGTGAAFVPKNGLILSVPISPSDRRAGRLDPCRHRRHF